MKLSPRRALRSLPVALSAIVLLGVAGPARAADGGETFNDVTVNIHGGNAKAFNKCITHASKQARKNKPPHGNACSAFAVAQGGSVNLSNVSVFIDQEGGGRNTRSEVKINISGGDAVAVAACVNYLQGSASARQQCASSAVAEGGDVTLTDVSIVVFQLG